MEFLTLFVTTSVRLTLLGLSVFYNPQPRAPSPYLATRPGHYYTALAPCLSACGGLISPLRWICTQHETFNCDEVGNKRGTSCRGLSGFRRGQAVNGGIRLTTILIGCSNCRHFWRFSSIGSLRPPPFLPKGQGKGYHPVRGFIQLPGSSELSRG
ncbi:hypothetical protein VTK56DRAFT_7910 [Thermocarpiscus australiensis]